MDRITQEAYYRQRVLKYAAKHGVSGDMTEQWNR